MAIFRSIRSPSGRENATQVKIGVWCDVTIFPYNCEKACGWVNFVALFLDNCLELRDKWAHFGSTRTRATRQHMLKQKKFFEAGPPLLSSLGENFKKLNSLAESNVPCCVYRTMKTLDHVLWQKDQWWRWLPQISATFTWLQHRSDHQHNLLSPTTTTTTTAVLLPLTKMVNDLFYHHFYQLLSLCKVPPPPAATSTFFVC